MQDPGRPVMSSCNNGLAVAVPIIIECCPCASVLTFDTTVFVAVVVAVETATSRLRSGAAAELERGLHNEFISVENASTLSCQ